MNTSIRATYWIETPFPLEDAVAVLAGEQSCGTFTRLPGETDALRAAAGAVVERITPLDAVDHPSLPMRALPGRLGKAPRYQRAEIEVAWPLANLGASLPNLLATVAGNCRPRLRKPMPGRSSASPARANCWACMGGR